MTESTDFDVGALLERLASEGVDFVIIGGMAATLHGGSFITADLDIVYEPSRPNLEKLASVLGSFNVRLRGAEELAIRVDTSL